MQKGSYKWEGRQMINREIDRAADRQIDEALEDAAEPAPIFCGWDPSTWPATQD